LWDISKPLFQVGSLVNPHGFELLLEAIQTIAGERNESQKDTTEGHIIGIIKDLSAEQGLEGLAEWTIKTSDILRKFNEGRTDDKHVSPQWIGKKLKSLSLRHRTVNGRSEIVLSSGEYWTIISQYGYFSRKLALDSANPTETLPDKPLSLQDVAGVVGSSRECADPWEEGHEPTLFSDSDVNYDEYEERAAIMEFDGGLSREEAEREARRIVGKVDNVHR
jgi:hypothetical protein